jgi:tRNA U34 5-methylaminomethyl-2-thiouridine-forming methyltransferase MnmC
LRISFIHTSFGRMTSFAAAIESEFELVALAGGGCSLRARANGETFHPVVGPMAEARALHVAGSRIVERAATSPGPFVIWDVGLGAGANAIAAIEALRAEPPRAGTPVELHSFDCTTGPLEFALRHAEELGYPAPHAATLQRLLSGREAKVGPVRWRLHLGDFRAALRERTLPAPHAVMFDPYSPQANPTMWSLECFRDLRARLSPAVPCLLTSYTRSTAVRVTLLLAGFFVGRGPCIGEKDQTTLASNDPRLLDAALDAAWLDRVRRSTNAAPLRDAPQPGPIGAADFASLAQHPQFACGQAPASG